jgi:fibronectin type 3 domain-containing protein
VSAVNAVGEGSPSNEVSATPQAISAPSAPQNLSAKPANGKGVALTWSAPLSTGGSPITGYNVYRNTGSGTLNYLTNVTSTSYKDTSTVRGQLYCYQVSAVNAASEGPLTDPACATAR